MRGGILFVAAGSLLACGSSGSDSARDAGEDALAKDARAPGDASAEASRWGPLNEPVLIDGTPAMGAPVHQPSDWTMASGSWNAKAASYCATTGRIVFESRRGDLLGGSIPSSAIKAAGISEYFQSGAATGTLAAIGTSVLYVAAADGSGPTCIGCETLTDGAGGAAVYKAAPGTSGTPGAVVRQIGATIDANRNKDLAHWTPDCHWIVAGVEMPRHAGVHVIGDAEVGLFNDLWAISEDGKTWVQLTDYASTWAYADPVAPMPYQCTDPSCTIGCQYGKAAPFGAYSCSAKGAPPPASGTMRPTVSTALSGGVPGSAKIFWAERVGITLDPAQPEYTWAGVLQLASADIVLVGGLPALANYVRNRTPTPASPAGVGLWANPGGATTIGAGYESWSFSEDDATFYFASDAFLSTSSASVTQAVGPSSEAFTDSIGWTWSAPSPALTDVTRHDPVVYAYEPNAAPAPVDDYGHWEEPIVASRGAATPFLAFASSADLDPTWNPDDSSSTFGLEVWLVRVDRTKAASKLTHFNEPATAPRVNAYATAIDPSDQSLFVSVEPRSAGTDAPGALYRLRPSLP